MYISKSLRLHFGRRQQHVRNIILGQLWTQVASVHHEYGRLTLAIAGLLFQFHLQNLFNLCATLYWQLASQLFCANRLSYRVVSYRRRSFTVPLYMRVHGVCVPLLASAAVPA